MLHTLDDDLDFFRETTGKYLAQFAPPQELRRLRDHDAGFEADYWRGGGELGWISLLVDEEHGGGSISGDRLVDLSVLAFEFGRHAAPGPLLPTNVSAWALSKHHAQPDLLADLMAGATIVSWAHSEGPPDDAPGCEALRIEVEGDELTLHGEKRPIEAAGQASHFLVSGRTGDGSTLVLVPADAAGLTVTPMRGVDLTRRFATLGFDGVRVPTSASLGAVGGAEDDIESMRLIALTMLNAEAVGALQTAFDLTLEWALDRYSFGRPLASYQAVKHRVADMKTWLEAGHALSDAATAAVAADSADAARLSDAAKAFVGEFGSDLMQECVQLHGGIGVTFEHDLHLFLRRHTTNRTLFGTPADHRRRIGATAAAAAPTTESEAQ